MTLRAFLPLLLVFTLTVPALAADAATAAPTPPAPSPVEPAGVPKIDAAAAAKLVAEGKAVLVDCREPSEWAETGVAGPAALLAKSDFDGPRTSWKPFLEQAAGKQIIIYCRSGNRAGLIGAALAAQGYNVANAGAFTAWEAAGLPVRKAGTAP